jgi:hypothetical protein
MAALVRSSHSDNDDIEGLRVRAAELEALVASRSGEISRVRLELTAFEIRYRQEVGLLHEQLDDLERAISEAELGELSAQGTTTAGKRGASAGAPRAEEPPRYTTDVVRRLFREVAKAIHPDLAHDERARDRRHTLMVEANQAYRLGDEERLRAILQSWENSAEAVQGSGPEATRLRLMRRMAQVEEQLNVIDGEMAEMKESPLWRLKAMVDEAAARGKDLVRDMANRLKRDIMVARNRLDAIEWRPPEQRAE